MILAIVIILGLALLTKYRSHLERFSNPKLFVTVVIVVFLTLNCYALLINFTRGLRALEVFDAETQLVNFAMAVLCGVTIVIRKHVLPPTAWGSIEEFRSQMKHSNFVKTTSSAEGVDVYERGPQRFVVTNDESNRVYCIEYFSGASNLGTRYVSYE